MLVNNNNCKSTNYFDEKFFLYLEEIDLCKRLKELKLLICKTPNILFITWVESHIIQIILIKWNYKEIGIICGLYFILIESITVISMHIKKLYLSFSQHL